MSRPPASLLAPSLRSSPSPSSASPSSASPEARTAQAVEGLLRDLGPRLRRGDPAPVEWPGGLASPSNRLATGIPDLDALVGGGLPRGRLSEIAGPLSSGRTSVTLALLARATRAGEVVAVVDAADAFDPPSAEAAGVALDRVLWVRAPRLQEATRCSEHLLEARGFALVVLDLALDTAREAERVRLAPAIARRLTRAAAASGTALVLLSVERVAGTHADLALRMQPTAAHFRGTPTLLEELESEAVVVRHRAGPAERVAAVRLGAASRAA